MTCASWIAALEDEAWNQAVEDGVVIVSVQTELEEVTRCEGRLLREEGEGDVARGGVDY